jgi:hypothetical protein
MRGRFVRKICDRFSNRINKLLKLRPEVFLGNRLRSGGSKQGREVLLGI